MSKLLKFSLFYRINFLILLHIFVIVMILSCGKKDNATPIELKCRLSIISGKFSDSKIKFNYNNLRQLISYSSPMEPIFSTFKYDLKGNVIEVIYYSDTTINLQKPYTVFKPNYDSNNMLSGYSTDWKNNSNANGIEYVSVIMDEKKQVIGLKYPTYMFNLVYDSRGNVIKTYGSSLQNPQAIPKIYWEYEYDNMRNKYQNLPWIFQFLHTENKGFGANNCISEKFVDGNSVRENSLLKIAYNGNDYPLGLFFSDSKDLIINYEYKCD